VVHSQKVCLSRCHVLSKQICAARRILNNDITAAELEEIIARTPAGEQVVYDGREIGSTDTIAEKLSQLN
jgi:hypothetical protein